MLDNGVSRRAGCLGRATLFNSDINVGRLISDCLGYFDDSINPSRSIRSGIRGRDPKGPPELRRTGDESKVPPLEVAFHPAFALMHSI